VSQPSDSSLVVTASTRAEPASKDTQCIRVTICQKRGRSQSQLIRSGPAIIITLMKHHHRQYVVRSYIPSTVREHSIQIFKIQMQRI